MPLSASRQGVAGFLKRFDDTGTIKRKPGSGRPSKVTAEIKAIVEQQMRLDDETSATQWEVFITQKRIIRIYGREGMRVN